MTPQRDPNVWHSGIKNNNTEFAEIDLGGTFAISSIRILGRSDCCLAGSGTDRNSEMRIEINADTGEPQKASYAAQIAKVLQASAAVSGAASGAFAMQKSLHVVTLAGTGEGAYADGPGASAKFNKPSGIVLDSTGNIYIADMQNHRIRKMTPTGVVSTFAGSGTAGFANATGTAAQFNKPIGLAIDAANNIYVADHNNNATRKITPAGVVTTIDQTCAYPMGCAVDSAGNVYIAATYNHRIKKVTPAGVLSVLAGSETMGNADGPGASATFTYPSSVGVHPTTGDPM
jgi:hypothetical protein